ncbi:MAG TPA: L,D-transpeptidase [Acidimicrobiales bacterium]|nr:L,D-transpeptidase [Acidimicrobiales bacterium]
MTGRRGIAAVLGLVLVGALGAACKGPSHEEAFVPEPPTTTAAPAPAAAQVPVIPGLPPQTKIAIAALATGPSVHVFSAPSAATPVQTLANPTAEGVTLAMLAVDQQGSDWYYVRLPERPNGSMGWIRASEVQLTPVDNRVVVSVGTRMLRVLDHNDQVLYETNVAVGKPRTPTPLGRFYIDIWMPNPGSPYGAYLLSIAGFSDALKTFEGGRGQVAMHGWSNTAVMGTAASNGCVRMRNGDITRVAGLAPVGTPVEIIA